MLIARSTSVEECSGNAASTRRMRMFTRWDGTFRSSLRAHRERQWCLSFGEAILPSALCIDKGIISKKRILFALRRLQCENFAAVFQREQTRWLINDDGLTTAQSA
jgi:hypothetical protein